MPNMVIGPIMSASEADNALHVDEYIYLHLAERDVTSIVHWNVLELFLDQSRIFSSSLVYVMM